jgi:DNA adenine methylase
MRFDSPLRYPGGKGSLAPFLGQTIELNDLIGCSYYEPFAGGAGAALSLLRQGVVNELHLNDLDPRITAFWYAALGESERFADAIMSIPVTIVEWRRQRQICYLADPRKTFELGFATFYLNRCNRSGIILGAAPIGGYAQTGKWRIDVRFYRESLAERILTIGRYRDQIHITNMDARNFLVESASGVSRRHETFAYLDPPYYANGNRLYLNPYDDEGHRDLAHYIQGQDDLMWVISYDDTDFIRNLYATCEISCLSLEYSLQRRRKAQELLISPPHVLLPASAESIDAQE